MVAGKKAPAKMGRFIFNTEVLIFLIEALAINSIVYEEIDELYETRSRAFYDHAVKSDLIKHPLIVCGNIRHEEYGRKALGILLHAMETGNKNVINGIDEIIKKGWPRAYHNASNHMNTEIAAYTKELRNACTQSVAGSMAELFVFYSLCIERMLPIVSKTDISGFFTALAVRSFIHSNDRYFNSYSKKSDEKRRELDILKERICSDFGIDITADNQIRVGDNELNKLYKFA